MKRLLIIVFILFLVAPVSFANKEIQVQDSLLTNPNIIPQLQEVKLQGGVSFDEDKTIYLDKEIDRPALNVKTPNTLIPVYTLTYSDSRIRSRSALVHAGKLSGEEYYMSPIFHYIREQVGNFSYGSYYGATMDSAQLTYSTSWFTRYDTNHFALTGTFSTDSQSIDGAYKSMLGISPEIKLTKSLAIRDTFKTYMGLPVKKNSISLIYTPQLKHYIDGLRFELGLSQSFYESGITNSSVEFSTKFKL